jgi:hypothetical protein
VGGKPAASKWSLRQSPGVAPVTPLNSRNNLLLSRIEYPILLNIQR